MKSLSIDLNFASKSELKNQFRKIESMIELGINSLAGDHISFTLRDETESRTEIVNGVKCTVIQSKMNHKKTRI